MRSSSQGRAQGWVDALAAASAWPGRIASWLTLAILACIVLTILFSALRLSTLLVWGPEIPLFGGRLTVNGLVELQWHFFGVMVLLGGVYTLREDAHVRVDFLYANLSARGRRIIDILGDLLFLLPFCGIVFWMSLGFVERAYISGERSTYGGLIDRYLIKAMIPIGLGLLFVSGVLRIVQNVLGLVLGGEGAGRERR